MNQKLTRNVAQCLICLDIVESKHVHDIQHCSCVKLSVDGGLEYTRRVGDSDKYKDLSETVSTFYVV